MAKHAFEKFSNKTATGAKKKEAIRQEKRKIKAELRAQGEEFRRKKYEKMRGISSSEPSAGRPGKKKIEIEKKGGYRKDSNESTDRKPYEKTTRAARQEATTNYQPPASEASRGASERKPYEKKEPSTGYQKTNRSSSREASTSNYKSKTANFRGTSERKSYEKREQSSGYQITTRPPKQESAANDQPPTANQSEPVTNASPRKRTYNKPVDGPRYKQGKPIQKTYEQITQKPVTKGDGDLMPLNKFIAHCGVSGRREAAQIVKEGKVQVNGSIVYEPGYKISPDDTVLLKGKQVYVQKNLVYILLNKPKDFITTSDDPQGRKTVLDLIKEATKERVYPVGRLDRNTTGVLLLTNDGELAQKLTHPSYEVKKLYEVTLDKPLVKKDADNILNGITLEDGSIKANALGYADAKDKTVIGIEIHSGRNRIVRRIFEHLGYKVKNLDRVMFANLTKKNVERGKWRFLNEKEIRLLKYMNQSFIKTKSLKEA